MTKECAKNLYSRIHAIGIDTYAERHSMKSLCLTYTQKCERPRRSFDSKLEAVMEILHCCIEDIG